MQAALDGSSSPDAHDGLASLRAARERLAEALDTIKAGNDRMGEYITAIAGGGISSPAPSTAPPAPPRGWDSAPDLATARDGMPRLGEVTPGRRAHILDGDGDGESGGHRWDSAIPDKTKFPYEWDDNKIIGEISDIALRPDKTPTTRRRGGWICEGTRDGVTIEVVINRDGQVWTGYPLRGRGVERNPGEW